MKRFVYDLTGTRLLRVEEAEPVCGHDFCEACGACLACEGGERCWSSRETDGEHFWVVYEEVLDAAT